MAIGPHLVDGTQDGFTGTQYCNSAYRVAGYVNKAEMLGSGTLRVLQGKTIQCDEEVLYSYHDSYWSRWAAKRARGRPAKPTTEGACGSMHEGMEPQTPSGDVGGVQNSELNKRPRLGRPPVSVPSSKKSTRKKPARSMRWTEHGRNEFTEKVAHTVPSPSRQSAQRRFERGEGGGVT